MLPGNYSEFLPGPQLEMTGDATSASPKYLYCTPQVLPLCNQQLPITGIFQYPSPKGQRLQRGHHMGLNGVGC